MARSASLAAGLVIALAASAPAEVNELGYDIAPVTWTDGSGQVEAGAALYDEHCAQCHGMDGAGDGTMADLVHPRPRDFTTGTYKLRHTLAGETPTEDDIFRTIARGMPGTSMPAWEGMLTDGEIRSLVHFLKTLAPPFQKFPAEEQYRVGDPLPSSAESLERGREVYDELQCAKCHGDGGRGNGPSAEELVDEWGEKIWPANLYQPWTFRGGPTREDVYRTLVTGLGGTPMPAYAPSVSSEDAWHLANYVFSLGREPSREIAVRAARVEAIPEDPQAPEWEAAPGADFRLSGQIIREPRLFTPTVGDVTVKALHDGTEIALLVIWADRTADDGSADSPPDRVLVQFPAEELEGSEKPYFLMGDAAHPVDCWEWSAIGKVQNLLAHGMDDVETKPGAVRGEGHRGDGEYRVLFRRPLETENETDVQFRAGDFVPVAVHVWDGGNGEEGARRAVSAWYFVLVEPETPSTVFVWPAAVVFLGLGAEVWIVRRLRRRKS